MIRKLSTIGASLLVAISIFLAIVASPGPAMATAPNVPAYPGAVVSLVSTSYTTATASYTLTGRNWLNYSTADIYLAVSMPNNVNTTTVKLQSSADYVNWVTDNSALFTLVTTTVTSTNVTAKGAYYRLVIAPTNANTETLTGFAVLR